MTTTTRKRISLYTAILGALSAVFLEAAHTPGDGWLRASVIVGIFALAAMRLYLFYEGTALAEIDKAKAKIAFKLSVLLSVALAGYGIAIWYVNPAFENYALALFLMLQMGLAFTEWVFSTRTGEEVNTVLERLQTRSNERLSLAMYFRSMTKDQAKTILSNTKTIDLLSKENAKQNNRIVNLDEKVLLHTKKQAKLKSYQPKVDRINGAPVCLCPGCLENGEVNILRGGSRALVLVCSECGFEINVPKKVKA